MLQHDKKLDYKPSFLGKYASISHKESYGILIALTGITFVAYLVIYMYTKTIYPYIPKAYGGNKTEIATVFIDEKQVEAKIINESSTWVTYITESKVVKLKITDIDKIEY